MVLVNGLVNQTVDSDFLLALENSLTSKFILISKRMEEIIPKLIKYKLVTFIYFCFKKKEVTDGN